MSKLPNPSNEYDVLSVAQYWSHLELNKKIDVLPTERDYDTKETRVHNHLICKQTLNHLPKLASLVKKTGLAKWVSVLLRTRWLWIRVSLAS